MNSQTRIQKLLKIPVDNATYTDIHKAVIKGNLKRVKLYLDRGPGPWGTVDSLDWWGRTPLYRAVDKNNVPIVLEILTQGATVDLREKLWWRTPLHLACDKGYFECARQLLAYDATVDISAKEGWTPLMLAAANGHTEIVQMLLNVKANYKLRTKNDFQALHHAAKNNHADIVHLLLLQQNSDPNVRIYEKGPDSAAHRRGAQFRKGRRRPAIARRGSELPGQARVGRASLGRLQRCLGSDTRAYIALQLRFAHKEQRRPRSSRPVLAKVQDVGADKANAADLGVRSKSLQQRSSRSKARPRREGRLWPRRSGPSKEPERSGKEPDQGKIDSMEPSQRLRSLASNLKGISTRFRDFIAADLRRRNQQGVKEKTAVVSTIEDALANAKQCIDVCKAMSRSNKAAMITALATENGDYDVDEDEMESLRDARNIDMGEKKEGAVAERLEGRGCCTSRRWNYTWKTWT